MFVNRDDSDKNDCHMIKITEFHKLFGKLIYLTFIRPNISYVVQILILYMHKSRKSYLDIAFILLHYLKACLGNGVSFIRSDSLSLVGSVDVD